MHVILKSLAVLGALGFMASLVVHFCALAGIANGSSDAVWMLHGGVFVVWLPTVLVAQRLTRHATQINFWKAILRRCPQWMKIGAGVVFPYAFVNFFVTIALGQGAEINDLRLFSGHWMAFYYVGGAALYSAGQLWDEADRQCPNGHDIAPFAKFCVECGAKLSRPLA